MKILLVTPEPPAPATHGAAVRNGHLLAALGERHDVDVVTLRRLDQSVPTELAGARRFAAVAGRSRSSLGRAINAIPGRAPDLVFRHDAARFRATIQRQLLPGGYDAVHLEGLQLATIVHDVRATFAGMRRGPLVVYDAHNVEWELQRDLAAASTGPRAWYARRQATLLRSVERWVVGNSDLTIASTDRDAETLRRLGGDTVVTVPHPVEVPACRPGVRRLARRPRVLFASNFAYRPNAASAGWMFGAVWPRVVRRVPEAVLRVVGPESPALRPIAPVASDIGGVVDDSAAEHAAAWIAVSPAQVGAGAPYKVLHAYSAGRPVVAHGAGLAGLDDHGRVGLVAAAAADDFADAIVRLIEDAAGREKLGEAGFAYVKEAHALPIVGEQILRAYAELEAGRFAEAAT